MLYEILAMIAREKVKTDPRDPFAHMRIHTGRRHFALVLSAHAHFLDWFGGQDPQALGLPDGDLPPDAPREPGHCARRRGQSGRPDRDQRERGRYGADVPARRAGAAAVTRGCLEPSWTTPCVLPSSCLVVQGHEGFGAPLAGMEIDSPWLDKTDFMMA